MHQKRNKWTGACGQSHSSRSLKQSQCLPKWLGAYVVWHPDGLPESSFFMNLEEGDVGRVGHISHVGHVGGVGDILRLFVLRLFEPLDLLHHD